MEDKKWTHAAWMAIGAAALTPPNLLLGILADLPLDGGPIQVFVAVMALIVGTTAAALSLIALYRFRELLNERYSYHGIDALVTFVIVTISLLVLTSVVGRVLMSLVGVDGESALLALVFVAPMMLLGVATGIVSIILGIKLFGLENDLQHLIRPYAVFSIVGGACFALVLLAPLGMLLLIGENIVLALLFFRANESEATVEFV
jgi:hypothetical protein